VLLKCRRNYPTKPKEEREDPMDEQQQRVNEAAERFAEALRDSYQTVASRGESAQQLNAEMTQ